MKRRTCIAALGSAAAIAGAGALAGHAGPAAAQPASAPPAGVRTRPIPKTGEPLPAVGLGTWLTFDLDPADAAGMARRRAVLDQLLAGGGTLVDSSPMYGRAERVMGRLLEGHPGRTRVFSATKVWTPLASYGATQMRRSLALWGLPRVDLMQVHNLLTWRDHLETLRAWKAEGRIRHLGVTTSHGRDHGELESILREQALDFVQLTYNPVDRRAEPLMQLAASRGVAVIVNRPFDGGALLQRLASRPLPPLARELGCSGWGSLVLKWELAHPAVTCAIPATTNPEHARQNIEALRGPLPDAAQRDALTKLLA